MKHSTLVLHLGAILSSKTYQEKAQKMGWCLFYRLMLVIPATWEAEIGRITVQGSLDLKIGRIHPINKLCRVAYGGTY
jgi:hypothetical protein